MKNCKHKTTKEVGDGGMYTATVCAKCEEVTDSHKVNLKQQLLKALEANVFVKSINTTTDEVKKLNPIIEDREEIIYISGEFDSHGLIEALNTILNQN